MNRHIFVDRLSIRLAAAASRARFFGADIAAPGWRELLDAIELEVPSLGAEGIFELQARCPWADDLHPAVLVHRWLGADRPTLVFHHGNNEQPFAMGPRAKNTFFHAFVKDGEPEGLNLVALRAPYHDVPLPEYARQISRLAAFKAMLAVSVRLADAVLARLRALGCERTLLAGISLGGWVVNLHRAWFGGAAAYAPLLAGAGLGDIFFTRTYRRMLAPLGRAHEAEVRSALDFDEALLAAPRANVFPLLARFDQIIELDRQRRSYGDIPIEVIDRGHVTAALSPDLLRRHVLGVAARI